MRAVRYVVVLACVLAAVAGPAVGTGGASGAGPIELRYTVDRTPEPGIVRITATVGYAPPSVTAVSLDPLDRATLESLDGFERQGGRLMWDGDGPASVTYTIPAAPDGEGRRDERGGRGLGTADASDWTYVASSRVTFPAAYRYYGDDPGLHRSFEATDPGYAGSSVAFLGRYETYEARSGGQTIRLVVPQAAEFSSRRRGEVRATLLDAAELFDGGGADDAVNVFVTTEPIRRGGVSYPAGGRAVQDVWVRDDVPVDAADNTWIHEYVHTRQAFETTRRTRWLEEASAEYYAAVLTLRQDRIEWRTFRRHVRTRTNADDQLTDPSKWSDSRTPYSKGRRVLAALDAEIGRRSGGEASLEDVFARMNRHDGPVSYADFRRFVNRAAGADLSAWLDRYVAGRQAPRIPDAPIRYVEGPDRDADGDGLDAARERAVGANPFAPDTDSDGLPDTREVALGSDPARANTDGDGLDDGTEVNFGVDPTARDTDGDGLPDGEERRRGLDPAERHSDGDRLADGAEIDAGSDPSDWDTDDDNLGDAREVTLGTDPADADTDGDGFSDRREVRAGTDPLSKTGWLAVWLAELF